MKRLAPDSETTARTRALYNRHRSYRKLGRTKYGQQLELLARAERSAFECRNHVEDVPGMWTVWTDPRIDPPSLDEAIVLLRKLARNNRALHWQIEHVIQGLMRRTSPPALFADHEALADHVQTAAERFRSEIDKTAARVASADGEKPRKVFTKAEKQRRREAARHDLCRNLFAYRLLGLADLNPQHRCAFSLLAATAVD